MITHRADLEGVDWEALRHDLIHDEFHNGRTAQQLQRSFENSQHVAIAFDGQRCVATGRLLSDGVGNAYAIDVWTHSGYRRRGIATQIMSSLIATVPGQHIYLQTDAASDFYRKLGFRPQPEGLSMVSGEYLNNVSRLE